MIELLRALRLGTINLFGIAVPGLLVLFLSGFGLLLPLTVVAMDIIDVSSTAYATFFDANRWIIIAIGIVFAYVAGYILRLASPDDLDQLSGVRVLSEMDDDEKRSWPYTGKKGDKFPYFNFRAYLTARQLDHLLDLVKWGDDAHLSGVSAKENEQTTKRSKTAIHIMKLNIMMKCPELSAIIESNEAHIRLLSGVWLSIRATKWMLIAGASLTGSMAIFVGDGAHPHYLVHSVTGIFVIKAVQSAQTRIENLFHYRRVNELVYIVEAAHLANDCTPRETS